MQARGLDALESGRPRPPLTLGAAVVALTTTMLLPSTTRACATCACGDPTLTVMGAQQPFEQRLRFSLEGLYRTDAIGLEGVNRIELSEQRVTLGAAYAPTSWVMLSASVPLVRRELTEVSLAEETLVGIGDAELRARLFVLRDRALAPRHLLALVAGIKLPTGPLERDATGEYRAPELQLGTGSFDPLGGVSYAHFAEPWSFYASEILYVPTAGPDDTRVGMSWRGTHAAQYQIDEAWALRLAVNTRLDDRTERGDQTEPDSGGFVGFVAPAVVVSPLVDLVLNLEVSLPVVNALVGHHDEGAIVTLGAVYDV